MDSGQIVKRPDPQVLREAIFRAETKLAAFPQADIEYTHRFTPGLYTREMFAPKGVMMTGAIHKTKHISIFLEGVLLVPDESGKSVILSAPIVETAMPGIKRIGLVLEDLRWITVHPTELTDVDDILDEIVTNDFTEVEHLIEDLA